MISRFEWVEVRPLLGATYESEPVMKELKDMHAIIVTGGKQYKVTEGDTLFIEKLPVEAFATHPVITTFAKSDEDLYRVVDPAGIVPNIRYRIKNETTIISMVASQLGIAVMSELFLHNLPAGVAVRELDSTHNHRITGVALRSREETSPSTRKFLEYVRTCLGPFPGNAEKL